MRLNGVIYNMSDAEGKSNYAYVGFWRLFFNNKTSFFSIPLNIVPCVVLPLLFTEAADGHPPPRVRPPALGLRKGGQKGPRFRTGRQKCPLPDNALAKTEASL